MEKSDLSVEVRKVTEKSKVTAEKMHAAIETQEAEAAVKKKKPETTATEEAGLTAKQKETQAVVTRKESGLIIVGEEAGLIVKRETTKATLATEEKEIIVDTENSEETEAAAEIEEVGKEVSVEIEVTKIKVKFDEDSNMADFILDVIASIPPIGNVDPAEIAEAAKVVREAAISAIPMVVPMIVNVPYFLRILKGYKTKWSDKRAKRAAALAKKAKVYTGLKKGKVQDGAREAEESPSPKQNIKNEKTKGKEKVLTGKCFTGDTLVLTKTGLRPIKQIQKGDDIYSRNAHTEEVALKKVEEVFRTEAHTIYHIQMDGETELKTTAYHPIFVKDKGWMNAINLREDMLIETMEDTAQVTKIVKIRYEDPVEVFNFHVEEWESYFVSEKSVYVHNSKGAHANEHPNGTYKDAPYHSSGKANHKGSNKGKGYKSERPKNGQAALDHSIPAKSDSSNKRLAREGDKVVVLHQERPGVYHGFLKDFKELPQEDKNALVSAGLFNRRGK